MKSEEALRERKKTLNWLLDVLPEHSEVNFKLRQNLETRVKELEIVLEDLK